MLTEEQLFTRFAGKSLLLDSNLLLVYLCGHLGPQNFKRFKRVSDYTIDDYELLVRLLRHFSVLVTTPHILTEVSNLANSLPAWLKPSWSQIFTTLLALQGEAHGFREHWTPAADLVKMPEFAEFGITDSALTKLSPEALVITEDYRLSGTLRSRGIPVINFGDLRKIQQHL